MRVFRSEMVHNYVDYSFGYAIYGRPDTPEEVQEALDQGFLPYTGNKISVPNSYYLARSLRIHTKPFELSSENRRVLRKYGDSQVELRLQSISDYPWKEEDSLFCLEYAGERFSSDFPPKRLERIRLHSHLTHYLEIYIDNQRQALIFLHCGARGWHYWFAFLDLEAQRPLGKFAMLRTAQFAEENQKSHLYIGTCYGWHSLYKVRDFKTLSFFDGAEWKKDKKILKAWCKSDENHPFTDRLKRES